LKKISLFMRLSFQPASLRLRSTCGVYGLLSILVVLTSAAVAGNDEPSSLPAAVRNLREQTTPAVATAAAGVKIPPFLLIQEDDTMDTLHSGDYNTGSGEIVVEAHRNMKWKLTRSRKLELESDKRRRVRARARNRARVWYDQRQRAWQRERQWERSREFNVDRRKRIRDWEKQKRNIKNDKLRAERDARLGAKAARIARSKRHKAQEKDQENRIQARHEERAKEREKEEKAARAEMKMKFGLT